MDMMIKVDAAAKRLLPGSIYQKLKTAIHMSSKSRREANQWLRENCADIQGSVLSIGSAEDGDGEGGRYRDYFVRVDSYTTSEVMEHPDADLLLDVRNMPEVGDDSYDCIFCSGVLEHVDEHRKAVDEMTRVLKPGGILLLGVPFRQATHMEPFDFWRFTEYGIRFLLKDSFEILNLQGIDNTIHNFPAAYWTKARKRSD